MSSTLEERLDSLLNELADAVPPGGKPPVLVAVSKTVDSNTVRRAYRAGQRDFGENRVQALLSKMDELSDLPDIRWHFIGRLQRNKVRKILGRVALVHSVDSLRLATAIDRIAGEEGLDEVPVLLEVNVSGESSKAGFKADELLSSTGEELARLERTGIRGLMTMAPFVDDEDVLRSVFSSLAELAARLSERHGFGRELSMGMSNDYRVAVQEGATYVRIGSRIFHDG